MSSFAYRGRDSRPRGSWRGASSRSKLSTDVSRHPSPPFGSLIENLSRANVQTGGKSQSGLSSRAEITDCNHVASYNWIDSKEPVILIPGMPPAWTPLDEPRKLKEDSGDYYRDQNAARAPQYPMEPSVHALFAADEAFDTQSVDLYACSATMGGLLRFLRQVDKPFRFFVEAVGNTVFFIRHEHSPTELLEGVKGYGHTFPESYTTWNAEVKGSASHQRLLRYSFAGLDCIYRFEADGYLPDVVEGLLPPSKTSKASLAPDPNDIASVMDDMRVASSKAANVADGNIEIRQAGQKIPHDSIFDLKTRSVRNPRYVMVEEMPRFWVSQTPNLVLARHNNGVFQDVAVKDIQSDVDDWESENQDILHQLSWLLNKIIAVARARKDGKLEVRRKDVNILELREQDTDSHDVLPPDLKLKWESGDKSNAAFSADGDSSDDSFNSSHAENGFRDSFVSGSTDYDYYDAGRSDDESEKDFTACSADDCGYCGHCSY